VFTVPPLAVVSPIRSLFFFAPHGGPRELPSFPTRRSSDLVEETDALTPADIELARRSTPEPVFRQEFMCDFTVAAMNALIGIDTVTAAAGRHLSIDQYSFAPKVLGVDVARQGDDRSAIMRRQGLATWKPKVLQGGNSLHVATAVAAEIQEFQ